VGHPLAGPVAITVTNGGKTVAQVDPRDLVALPPPSDVRNLVAGGPDQAALATMDTRGNVWIPIQFSGFGTTVMPMPKCPMTLTPITAFAVGVTVRAMPSFYPDAPPTYPPFRILKRVDMFIGDMLINGTNYYGEHVGMLPVLRVSRGWGMKVCAVNDAVDLVLRAPGRPRWAKPWSTFAEWMPDSAPLQIVMSYLNAGQVDINTTPLDAFGQECQIQ
jgi:hypothetical protein